MNEPMSLKNMNRLGIFYYANDQKYIAYSCLKLDVSFTVRYDVAICT